MGGGGQQRSEGGHGWGLGGLLVFACAAKLVKLDFGASGEVFRAVRKADGIAVAMKRIFLKDSPRQQAQVENEIASMAAIHHPGQASPRPPPPTPPRPSLTHPGRGTQGE